MENLLIFIVSYKILKQQDKARFVEHKDANCAPNSL